MSTTGKDSSQPSSKKFLFELDRHHNRKPQKIKIQREADCEASSLRHIYNTVGALIVQGISWKMR